MAKRHKRLGDPVKAGWEYRALAGQSIEQAANKAVHLANEEGQTFTLLFNEKRVEVPPGSFVKDVIRMYGEVYEADHKKWKESPEGIAHTLAMKEQKDKSAKLKAEGPLKFTVVEGQEDEWNKQVEMNDDDYGSCAIRYVARWANMMEERLANGAEGLTIGDIAKDTSHEADTEGVTGYMYGISVSILAKVWVHGEELRRWHNLDSGGEKQGKKANESGGTINPAIFTIGGDDE